MIEHKVEVGYKPPQVEQLNQLAQEGWRLVSVTRSSSIRRKRSVSVVWRSFFMRAVPSPRINNEEPKEEEKMLDIFSVMDHLERYNTFTKQFARIEFGPMGDFCRLVIPDPKDPVAPSDALAGRIKTVIDFPNPYGLMQFLAQHIEVRQ